MSTATDIAVRGNTELAIDPAADSWSAKQLAGLRHLGVQSASQADLAIFYHQCVKTGLDPFAKQIYMIERQGKQTIQTGIDGFRLVARRAADVAHHSLSYSDTLYCGKDRQWVDVWLENEPPAAAKVTVFRNGDPYPAVAVFNEYAGRKRDGSLNSMWASKGSLMIGKCAEALALRKAFPQDLSGIFISEELAQDHAAEESQAPVSARSGVARLQAAVAPETIDAEPVETPEPVAESATEPVVVESDEVKLATRAQLAEIGKAFQAVTWTDKEDRLRAVQGFVGRPVAAPKDLTEAEAQVVLDVLAECAKEDDPQQAVTDTLEAMRPTEPAQDALQVELGDGE